MRRGARTEVPALELREERLEPVGMFVVNGDGLHVRPRSRVEGVDLARPAHWICALLRRANKNAPIQ
jgi:hypothetical protein